MKSKTKAVGGSPVSGGAQDFTNFLRQGLTSGSFAGQQLPWQQNAIGQTLGMGGVIDKLLRGDVGDPLSLTKYFQGGNTGFANLGSINPNYQAPNFSGFNFQTPNITFNPAALTSPNNITAGQAGPANFSSALSQIQGASGFNPDDLSKIMQQELERNVATQNAGLQGSGTGFMSSGKTLGESLIRANAAPQLGLALNQIRSGQVNQALNLAGMNQNTDLANIQAALQAASANQGAGLQFNNQQLNQSGMGLQAQGMNADIINQLNQLGLNQSLARNTFNQGNAQFGANMDLNAQIENIRNALQNQQLGNQYSLGLGNMFQGFQGNQIGAQQNTLGQLFNALNQLNALGTPQAQMVQQPSMFQQITGGIGNLAGGLAPFFTGGLNFGNPFGGGPPQIDQPFPQIGSTPYTLPNYPMPPVSRP